MLADHARSVPLSKAGPKILEPVYDVEVSVPADYLGDVMSDLQDAVPDYGYE